MMLVDKGYYDYDYKRPESKETKQPTYDETVKSEEETHRMLAIFGWKPQPKTERSANDMSVDELQQTAINELNKRKKHKVRNGDE